MYAKITQNFRSPNAFNPDMYDHMQFMWVLEITHRDSCILGKHSSNLAVSPALFLCAMDITCYRAG